MTSIHVTDLTKDSRSARASAARRSGPSTRCRSTCCPAARSPSWASPARASRPSPACSRSSRSPSSGKIDVTLDDGTPVMGSVYRRHVQMVFQDPFASLNPFHSIEHHIARPLRIHRRTEGPRRDARARARRCSSASTCAPPRTWRARRPHELSGGQRQRVAIARALAPGAQVLIADEPVSMLDVSIRLGVLNLMGRLQREDNLAVLYITHDLATARHFSDEILVLYRGRVVERGPADDVILDPHHDYTKLLALAAPDPERVGKVVSDESAPDRVDHRQLDLLRPLRGGVGAGRVRPGRRRARREGRGALT